MQNPPEAKITVIRSWQSKGGKWRTSLIRNDFPGCPAEQTCKGVAIPPTSNYYADDYERLSGDYCSIGRLFICEGGKGEAHAIATIERSLAYYPSTMHIVKEEQGESTMHAAYIKQQKHAASLKAGDRVAYSAMWLKSTQAGHDYAKLRGAIAQIGGHFPEGFLNSDGEDLSSQLLSGNFALVQWDGGPLKIVALFNLAKLKSAAFADAPYMGKTHA